MEGYLLKEEQLKRFIEDTEIKAYTIDMLKENNNYHVVLDGKHRIKISRKIYYKYK